MPLVIVLDVAGVILGTFCGCILRKYITRELKESMNLALAVISAAIGVSLLGKASHMSAAVLALLLGGILGHMLGIDRRLSNVSKLLPSSGGQETANILLVAFTLYCISTTGIIGALELGFSRDDTVLLTKAVMDFAASIFFAAGSGMILCVISLPLGLILMAFYGMAGFLMPMLTPEMIGDFSACGGLIQLLNAMRIAKIKDPPVADYMTALVLVFFISMIWRK